MPEYGAKYIIYQTCSSMKKSFFLLTLSQLIHSLKWILFSHLTCILLNQRLRSLPSQLLILHSFSKGLTIPLLWVPGSIESVFCCCKSELLQSAAWEKKNEILCKDTAATGIKSTEQSLFWYLIYRYQAFLPSKNVLWH